MIRRGDGKAGLSWRAHRLEDEVDALELELVLATDEIAIHRLSRELAERRAELRDLEAQIEHG